MSVTSLRQKAILDVRNGVADCICIAADGVQQEVGKGRGIGPLLRLLVNAPQVMKGGALVDKIIGRAAAFIAIQGGVKSVHGCVMSRGAAQLLAEYGVEATWDTLTEAIINRQGNGPCPMDAAVANATSPEEAVRLIQLTIA